MTTMTNLTTEHPTICPCCGAALHQFEQASMFEGREPHHMVECHTKSCDLYMVTLSGKQFNKLTPELIASYGATQKAAAK